MNKKTLNYLSSCWNKDNHSFCFSKDSNDTILSTSFGILLMNLINHNIIIDNNSFIANFLTSKTGKVFFIDKRFNTLKNNTTHKNDYMKYQFTFFYLIALDHLEEIIDIESIIEEFLDLDYLKKWFEGLNWGTFWYESNKIMFIMYFLSYLKKYTLKDYIKEKCNACIDLCFNILNTKQNSNTGLWGSEENNNDLKDGVFGTAHILIFYDFFNRTIQYKKQIIDSTLTIHSKTGLAVTNEGGACEDYDLVEIYLRCLKQSDYRKNEIFEVLTKIRNIINKSQNYDGGFSYRINRLKKYKFWQKNVLYRYSSWDLMETSVYHSDLWATYFRTLTLGCIEQIINGKTDYISYDLPGWGYMNG